MAGHAPYGIKALGQFSSIEADMVRDAYRASALKEIGGFARRAQLGRQSLSWAITALRWLTNREPAAGDYRAEPVLSRSTLNVVLGGASQRPSQ